MTAIPEWPNGDGPRILKLVANDVTIDGRVRKTASSLARAGFRVIVLGVDEKGLTDPREDLDGAVIIRVRPPNDPRVSTRLVRLSRAELRESFQYRSKVLRDRLQASRRNLTSLTQQMKAREKSRVSLSSRIWATVSRGLGLEEQSRLLVARKIGSLERRLRRKWRFAPHKLRAVVLQRRFQVASLIQRALARRPERSFRKGKWRRDLPELHRFEVALGPMIDALEPDLIHAHDVILLGVAARAKARAASAGRDLPIVYDAHEYIPGLPIDERRRTAFIDLEEEYVSEVNSVVTVSPGLAELFMERFGIAAGIVLNTPDADTASETSPIREVAGVPDGTRTIVYVGGIAAHRGAENLVNCLPLLPEDTLLVFVSATQSAYIGRLIDLAIQNGSNGRVRIVPYVEPDAVVSHIASADLSVIPLSRDVMNYEVALPNKLFQSIQAGVPVAVSDNPEMARFVRQYGIGEVFDGNSVTAMAEAITTILENPSPYREALMDPELRTLTSWSVQMKQLVSVYRELGVNVDR